MGLACIRWRRRRTGALARVELLSLLDEVGGAARPVHRPVGGRGGRGRLTPVHRVGDLFHVLAEVEAAADLLQAEVVVLHQLLADERLGVQVLEFEVLELRAELGPDVLLGALGEGAHLADHVRDVLDQLGQLVRAEDEHGEDHEGAQLHGPYVSEHPLLLVFSLLAVPAPGLGSASRHGPLHGTRPSCRRGTSGVTIGRRTGSGRPGTARTAVSPAQEAEPGLVSPAQEAEPSVRVSSRSLPSRRTVRPSRSPGRWARIFTISSSPLCTR